MRPPIRPARHLRTAALAAVLLLLPAARLAAQAPPAPSPAPSAARSAAEREVLEAEDEWIAATLKHDADAFASYMHDTWVGLKPDGNWSLKAPWTQAVRAGTSRYETVELSNRQVRFPRPDVAVITGDFTQKGKAGTKDNSYVGRYVETWVRIDGRWQAVANGFAPRPAAP
jgi:ketosteroid isomerase-like protein